MMSKVLLCSSFLMASVAGHGLISFPKSRMQICGVEIKPHMNDPRCSKAFEGDHSGGYNFMAVLTHTQGRKVKGPSNHVCGYDAEPWKGAETPWDKPIDWPTNNMKPGRNMIEWDIQWGNHFGDTEDFVYYITKPNFRFTVGKPLTWDDFESEPFCDLKYNDQNPTGNPDVQALHGKNLFKTYCNVPPRSGRHVIYGEWGRNKHTYERFHGCIDAQFSGNGPIATEAPPKPTPTPTDAPVYRTEAPSTGGCRRHVPRWGNCRAPGSCCIASKCVKYHHWYSQCH